MKNLKEFYDIFIQNLIIINNSYYNLCQNSRLFIKIIQIMNINFENVNDFQADRGINPQQNEQPQDQILQQNNIQNPIDDLNQVNPQNQGNENIIKIMKEIQEYDVQKVKQILMSSQMRCVFEHYKWLLVTQFYFIFEVFLNMLCYSIIISRNQNEIHINQYFRLEYVFIMFILLDAIKIIQNTLHYFHTLDHIEKANQNLILFPIEQQIKLWPNKAEDMAQLIIQNSCLLQKLQLFTQYLQKGTLIVTSIILLINIEVLFYQGLLFIQLTIILNLFRIINDLTYRFKLIQTDNFLRIKPLMFKMTKRRMLYLNRKTLFTFIIPFFYLYQINNILEVYLVLPEECSYLDIYFKITFAIIFCIIGELFIKLLMTYHKLNEEKDIFENSIKGFSEIIVLIGILYSWGVIYWNQDSLCISKAPEYLSIRQCIYQWPVNRILSYSCFHYAVLNKHVLSKSEQGIVTNQLTEENICIICLEQFQIGQQFTRLMCHKDHIYHKTCILDWFENAQVCPKCKEKDI
ncbi:hypothetical protein pb186bvf_017897 [Paramecium bursaria]